MGEAPYSFIKHREGLSIKRSVKIVRYWKNKETGNVVEVRALQNVVPENYLRIVFFDPQIKHELSMPFNKPRPNPYQPPNAPEVLMEPCFTDSYEEYGNFTSRA